MIRIRHQTFKLPANGTEILTLIRLETTNFKWLFGNSLYFYYDKIDKPWFGQINIKDKEFEIRRNGLGIFLDKVSAIIIEGTLTEENGNYKLEIHYRMSLIRTLCFLGLFILLGASPYIDKGLSGILSPIVLLIFLSILTVRDFKRTEKRFNEFIERVHSNAVQTKS